MGDIIHLFPPPSQEATLFLAKEDKMLRAIFGPFDDFEED